MPYDAGYERERLAKLFADVITSTGGVTTDGTTKALLGNSAVLKELILGTSLLYDETRKPLEHILNDLEADAINIIFMDGGDVDAEPPRAADRFLG